MMRLYNSPGSLCFLFKNQVTLSEHDNEMSRRLMRILKKLRESDPSCYQLSYLVRQGEQPREGLLLLVNLLEDQMGGISGYVDWILLMSFCAIAARYARMKG